MSRETRGVVTPPRLTRAEVARLTRQALAARLARAEARARASAPASAALMTVLAEVPTLAGVTGAVPALTTSPPADMLADALARAATDLVTLVSVAVESSLASAGFTADAAHAGADGRITVVGRDGGRRAIVRIDPDTGEALVDVSRGGFVVTDECGVRHDELLAALAAHGLAVVDAPPAGHLAQGVRDAVAEALPGHALTSTTDDRTLRILALPERQRVDNHDSKES